MRYSLLAVNKWNFEDINVLFSSYELAVVLNKYYLVLKYAKYMKKLSPKNSLHRVNNLKIFNKVYKELHTKEQIYPGDILQPNIIVLKDNETNLIISEVRFHKLMGGLIPNTITPEYLEEQKEVKKILSSVWQDYSCIYDFKYFDLR